MVEACPRLRHLILERMNLMDAVMNHILPHRRALRSPRFAFLGKLRDAFLADIPALLPNLRVRLSV